MTTSTFLRPVLALCFALAAVACGGGDDTAEPAATSDDSASGGTAVSIADSTFSPGDVTVSAGGAVEWTNTDSLPHTVAFEDDAIGDSEQLDQGDTFSATFETAGTFDYMCTIHPEMSGSVTVE